MVHPQDAGCAAYWSLRSGWMVSARTILSMVAGSCQRLCGIRVVHRMLPSSWGLRNGQRHRFVLKLQSFKENLRRLEGT